MWTYVYFWFDFPCETSASHTQLCKSLSVPVACTCLFYVLLFVWACIFPFVLCHEHSCVFDWVFICAHMCSFFKFACRSYVYLLFLVVLELLFLYVLVQLPWFLVVFVSISIHVETACMTTLTGSIGRAGQWPGDLADAGGPNPGSVRT